MDDDRQASKPTSDRAATDPPAPERRAFLAGATISISALLANSLSGCSQQATSPNDALRAEMNALGRIDPRWATFRETSRIPTGLARPTGLCAYGGKSLWVVGDMQLVELSAAGPAHVHSLPSAPTCIAAGSDGLLYIGLTDRAGIFHPDGSAVSIWNPASPQAHITAIDAGAGEVWLADWGAKTAQGYDYKGRLLTTIGARDEAHGYPGIIAPSPHFDVALGPGGHVYVTNPGLHRVETHTRAGEFVGAWGKPASDLTSFCGCCNPTDIALLPNGGFVTSEKGIPRVKIYNAAGRFIEVVAGPDRLPSNAMGQDLAVLGDGRIAVLDPIAKAVRVFTRFASPPKEIRA
ncbi:MAG: hypothetical protein P4L33_02485 [Capsulimonadaceae bacterium]|nr:hypothetical protein [Capsulimonadaceae bacterium]